jgi:hypothetical protein
VAQRAAIEAQWILIWTHATCFQVFNNQLTSLHAEVEQLAQLIQLDVRHLRIDLLVI